MEAEFSRSFDEYYLCKNMHCWRYSPYLHTNLYIAEKDQNLTNMEICNEKVMKQKSLFLVTLSIIILSKNFRKSIITLSTNPLPSWLCRDP